MNKLAIAFLAAVSLAAACRNRGSAERIAGFENYVEAVCKCKDIACVTREGEGYASANPGAAKAGVEAAKAMAEDSKFQRLAQKMTECRRKITIAAMTPPPG